MPESVIDLTGEDRKGKGGWQPESVADYVKRTTEERMEKVRAAMRGNEQSEATLSVPMTSSVPLTSPTPTSSVNVAQMHEMAVHASSSCDARQTGEENRIPPKYDAGNTGARRTVMTKPPSLPSGTQNVIQNLMAA